MNPITGQTNVRSRRFGRGAAHDIGTDLGRFVVTTMELPWQIAASRVGGNPKAILIADSMEINVVEAQVAAAPECDTVLAVGGGRAIDLGKYLAWKRGLRLVTLPTVLSVDAFVTPAAGIRRNHRVEYLGKTSPDPLIIDYDLLRTAPNELNAAGAGDLLSIHTAAYDWELAARCGRSEYPYAAEDVAAARRILADTISSADEIRHCTDAGLQAIVDGYLRVNTICLPADHYRVEEGSEHYLFYELEERLARPFLHGQIIGLGIYLLSRLQQNAPTEITAALDRLGIDYQPAAMDITRSDLAASLRALPAYVRRNNLWYTVIDHRPIDDAWIDAALADLDFA